MKLSKVFQKEGEKENLLQPFTNKSNNKFIWIFKNSVCCVNYSIQTSSTGASAQDIITLWAINSTTFFMEASTSFRVLRS